MIQRITHDTTSGDTSVDFRVERKVKTGLGVVECNDSRWRVQSGILVGYDASGSKIGVLYARVVVKPQDESVAAVVVGYR